MEPDPRSGLLGANETCRKLGHIDRSTLSYLVKTGRLVPKFTNEKGWKFFDPHDVADLATTYPRAQLQHRRRGPQLEGNLARRVFSCFRRAMSLAQVVDECRVHPLKVRELYEQYLLSLDHGRAEETNRKIEREHMKHAREMERQSAREEAERQRRRELDLKEREIIAKERELELEEYRLKYLVRPAAGAADAAPLEPAS